MTGLILKFRNREAMSEWIREQEELMNMNPEPDTLLHYRKFDSIDRNQLKDLFVLVRDGGEE